MKLTTRISFIVFLLCFGTTITLSVQLSHANSSASSDRVYDANGLWISNDASQDDCIAAIREAVAMEWGAVINENVASIKLTDYEKRNPGGGSVLVSHADNFKYIIRVDIPDVDIRRVIRPSIAIRYPLDLRPSVTKTQALNACNDFNLKSTGTWNASYDHNEKMIYFKSILPLHEDYLPWSTAIKMINDQMNFLGILMLGNAALPEDERVAIFNLVK